MTKGKGKVTKNLSLQTTKRQRYYSRKIFMRHNSNTSMSTRKRLTNKVYTGILLQIRAVPTNAVLITAISGECGKRERGTLPRRPSLRYKDTRFTKSIKESECKCGVMLINTCKNETAD